MFCVKAETKKTPTSSISLKVASLLVFPFPFFVSHMITVTSPLSSLSLTHLNLFSVQHNIQAGSQASNPLPQT